MHRFVSSEMRTEASFSIWKAVRMYWDRIVGTSCFELIAWVTSVTRASQSAISSSDFPLARISAIFSCFGNLPSSSSCTSLGLMMNRSFTLTSPVHESRWVFRSTKTSSGSPVPYHRSRKAMAPGVLSSRPWYSSNAELSRYTLLTSWASLRRCFPSAPKTKTGSRCETTYLIAVTNSGRTQYLVVFRKKPWVAASAASLWASPRRTLYSREMLRRTSE
mmetsp:Transcript_10199/g.23594  ORF Transcript_10199/g.23594 Transcript_10199/m.23594 type:complete len:219 (-) Transcript_10199:875-1531(-)